jgi:hypothetical protein
VVLGVVAFVAFYAPGTSTTAPGSSAPGSSDNAPSIRRQVALKVRNETWENGPHFDIGQNFREKLKGARIGVVPDNSSESDGTVLIEYSETKGAGYSAFGLGAPSSWGTNISFKMTLLGPTGNVLLSLMTEASTPSYASMGDLGLAAQKEFEKDDLFAVSEHFVGTGLGLESSHQKLLPLLLWVQTRESALSALDQAGFQPTSAREKAYMAMGRNEFGVMSEIGSPATEPLLKYLQRYDIAGYDPEAEIVGRYKRAVRTLAEISDPKTSKALLAELRKLKDTTFYPDVKVDLIRLLGAIGDEFVLADLSALEKNEEPTVARAAEQAVDSVRERMSQR